MFIGIDLGTSGVKTIILDQDQKLIAESNSRPLSVTRLQKGWSEQDPDMWWRAVCEALDALATSHPNEMAAIEGIGLSGQMYGATVLDADDKPLRSTILWNDTRSYQECDDLLTAVPDLMDIVYRKPTPGVTAPKLMWLRKHEPDIFKKIKTVLLPKDYVRLQLSGEKASDLADASGTLWVDLAKRKWSNKMLEATGLDVSHMPKIYEGMEATGQLRFALGQRWGMKKLPVIAAGGSDNSCGACGTGVVRDGEGTISLGTSGIIFVANSEPKKSGDTAIETLCHALPNLWHQMSVVLSATSCLTWLSARLKQNPGKLVMALGDAPRPATDLLFAPFLDGRWSPRFDINIRGGFLGLSHHHDDEMMTQAVMQGVVFALRECADAFRATGTELNQLLAIGGGSQSLLWLSMIATTLNLQLDRPELSTLGAAVGAARLAMIAVSDSTPDEVLLRPEIDQIITPSVEYSDSYEDAYQKWKVFTAQS